MNWLRRIFWRRSKGHLFAARAGKSTLYKFRPYATETDKTRVKEIIEDHTIYFARASQLNDPFDLSPRFKSTTRKEAVAGAEEFFSRHPEKLHEKMETLQYFRECDLLEIRRTAEAKTRRRIEEKYSVFSVAGNRKHPMLWSHYADSHKGLCIHFRATEGPLMGGAIKVTYQFQRPTLSLQLMTLSEHEIFTKILLTKGKFWSYEDEYRWCNYPDTDWTGIPIKFDGQRAHFSNPSELSGISVGARMPENDTSDIIEMAERHDPTLPVWRAIETDTFDFKFEQIA